MLKRIALLSFAFTVMSCVPTKEPLVELKKAKPDKRILGKWKGDSGEIVIELAERELVKKGLPKGFMKMSDGTVTYYFVCTTVGKDNYSYGVFLGKKLHRNGKTGAATLEAVNGSAKYLFCSKRYTVNGDRLTVEEGIDRDRIKTVVQKGLLKKGGLFNSSIKEVKMFLVANRDGLFKQKNSFRRIK